MKYSILILFLLLFSGCIDDKIKSFDECVAKGNVILETYPRQCKPPDGRLFTETVTDFYGCRNDLGYSWNETVRACVIESELNEVQKEAVRFVVAPLSYRVSVLEVDVLECFGCFDVYLQRNDNKQDLDIKLRNWKIVSGQNLYNKSSIENVSTV